MTAELAVGNAEYLQVSSIYYSVTQNNNLGSDNDDELAILNGVSFSVSEHSLTSIFGPNGSGKTTLLNAVADILKPPLNKGSITLKNKPVSEAKISFIFQDYNSSLMPWLTCQDNIAFPLKLQGVSKLQRRKEVQKLVKEELNLDIPLKNYPYQCSGGQKQMTAIARALIVNPDLLLMDEAFGALDYTTRFKLEQKLLDVWKIRRNTILMVSHDVDEAVFLSDRILVISRRPARVIDIVDVDLPRPRELKSTIVSEKFQSIRSRVINSFLEAQR